MAELGYAQDLKFWVLMTFGFDSRWEHFLFIKELMWCKFCIWIKALTAILSYASGLQKQKCFEYGRVCKWLKQADCKSATFGFRRFKSYLSHLSLILIRFILFNIPQMIFICVLSFPYQLRHIQQYYIGSNL